MNIAHFCIYIKEPPIEIHCDIETERELTVDEIIIKIQELVALLIPQAILKHEKEKGNHIIN